MPFKVKDRIGTVALLLVDLPECTPEEKERKIHSIHFLTALQLFDDKKYEKSMEVFKRICADPAEVIKLFPELDSRPVGESTSKKLKGENRKIALTALIDYLEFYKETVLQKESTGTNACQEKTANQDSVIQQLELIDNTLLKCYVQTYNAFVPNLLRLNNCSVEVAEKTLLQHGKHSELIIFYQIKEQHTKALELLRDQAKQADSTLRGFERTKDYLQHLGSEYIELILEFSDWILKEYPEEGLQIFIEDVVHVKNLPRPTILDFLLRDHEPIVIPYLEHVIHTWNDSNSLFHDALINMYIKKITDNKDIITKEGMHHTKLVNFLEKSSHYTPEGVLLYFPSDSLFEERAIVLGKLGRHEQALAIYVLILGDVEGAIRYCDNVANTSIKKEGVYFMLFKILINPEQVSALSGPLADVRKHPKTSVMNLEPALAILKKHADKISALEVLPLLPDSVSLSQLKHFLENALDGQLTQKRRVQVLKGLLYAEQMQVQELKQFHESKSVVIKEHTVCPVCKKRFGKNQSTFVKYPNGELVHYLCRLDK